jgi:hypothetical protein
MNQKTSIKSVIFLSLILFFLLFSFSPTIFELSQSDKLKDPNREFILEHNYYWPDFNLYLSKIRQGFEGHLMALEKYTSEPHAGSLIQEFYVILGLAGRFLNIDPNFSYQLGRLILSPLLLLIILTFIRYYFSSTRCHLVPEHNLVPEHKNNQFFWQILAFLIVVTSGSFPKFVTDAQGLLQVSRYMEWWSNIDALQRLTFIPHILFGQVVSFYLLFQLVIKTAIKQSAPTFHNYSRPLEFMKSFNNLTMKQFILFILLGNAAGLVFPPSLITLDGVLLLITFIKLKNFANSTSKKSYHQAAEDTNFEDPTYGKDDRVSLRPDTWRDAPAKAGGKHRNLEKLGVSEKFGIEVAFIILTLPSLLYLFFTTKTLPWSALVEFHRAHPMMIPFDQYVLGTGPIIFLGLLGAIVSIIKKDKRFQPLILWVLVTFSFASLFSVVREQSPLRFTQTGVFIPLGLLGAYFFYQLYQIRPIRLISLIGILLYLFINLFMMKVSHNWQTTFISQRVGANIPLVPYPPQTMYPLKTWMDGIRFLRDNTNHNDVVLAEITAGNFIPAYSGNTVYFGQSNTVDYDRKQLEVDRFFKGEMKEDEAKNFLQQGRIKYIFESVQEKDLSAQAGKSGGRSLDTSYPFLKSVYNTDLVTIYSY